MYITVRWFQIPVNLIFFVKVFDAANQLKHYPKYLSWFTPNWWTSIRCKMLWAVEIDRIEAFVYECIQIFLTQFHINEIASHL